MEKGRRRREVKEAEVVKELRRDGERVVVDKGWREEEARLDEDGRGGQGRVVGRRVVDAFELDARAEGARMREGMREDMVEG
jgi:hypothetical protein